MKILLVHNSYQQRGGEDVVFEQESQMLRKEGHDIVLYRRNNWEVDGYRGIKRVQLPLRTIWAQDTRREFADLLMDEKPDLVHVHNTFVMISPSIYSACQEAHVPVVQTLHNYRLFCPAATFFRNGQVCEECEQHSLWRGVAHSCYRDSRAATAAVALMLAVHRCRQTWTQDVTCYIALTNFARSKFIECGLPPNKVFVKPNFVDPDPRVRGSTGRELYVLFVGRLSPEKRVSTMLSAWGKIHKLQIPLVIIGGGPQLEALKREVISRKLTSINFQGQVSRADTLDAMHRARFLVFPSEWYENFPVTIAESFACGVPVVCSRMGAMQEIVEDGRTGLHFTTGDATDLAEKVQWAWTHPERLRSMGEEARHEYDNKYTAEKNYPLLMDIYERAMGGTSRATQ